MAHRDGSISKREELIVTPESFLLFANPLPEPMILISGGGFVLALNRSVEGRFGVSAQGWRGKTLADLVVDPDDEIARYLQLCCRSRQTVLGAITVRGPDEFACRVEGSLVGPKSEGSDAVVMLRLVPKKSAAGQFLALNLRIEELGREIHRRKRAEQDARESAERLRTTLTSIGDGVIATDINGCITNMNPVAESLTGWTNAEATGVPLTQVFNLVNETTRQPVQNPAERALREGTVVGLANQTILVAKAGTERPIDDSAAPIRTAEGRIVGCVLVFRDITERKQADLQLAEAFRFYNSSLDALTSHIAVLDENGIILEVNHAWRHFAEMNHFAGFNCGIGANYIEVCDTSSDECADDGSIAAGIRDVLSARKPVFEFEYPCHSPTEDRWFLLRVSRFQSPGPVRVVVSHDNVTQRRAAEERLRKLAAELFEADGRKNEFLATLAHELRNPLAPIRNGLQLIRLAGGNGAAVEQASDLIDRQLNQMVRLVDDLMDVSRVSTGKVHFRKERVPLASVVRSAVETSRPLIDQMGHDLTVTLPKHPLIVEVDLTRLAQVFLNLLNNAAKYSERNGRIWLTAEQQGSELIVSVKDTGIGIPADQLPRVFEMFSQVDRSLEKSQGGLGIGLCLVKRLVELHGGRIEARSEGPGKGSEFVVRLPVVVETSAPPEEARIAEEDKLALRILIVDDNRDSADSLAMLLKMMGNETCAAYDGEEAVTGAHSFRPDVILLDIGLPKLNGYEACRRIRGLEPGNEMVIIAQTGWGQEEDRQRTHDAGFDHHLVKPVDPQALMKLLRSLSKHEDHQLTKKD